MAELILNLGRIISRLDGAGAGDLERQHSHRHVHVIDHDPRIVGRLGQLVGVAGRNGRPIQVGPPPELDPQHDGCRVRQNLAVGSLNCKTCAPAPMPGGAVTTVPSALGVVELGDEPIVRVLARIGQVEPALGRGERRRTGGAAKPRRSCGRGSGPIGGPRGDRELVVEIGKRCSPPCPWYRWDRSP